MNRFRQALGVSSVITMYVMCFYYAFAMFSALLYGTSLVQAFVNSILAGVFLFRRHVIWHLPNLRFRR